MWKPAEEQSRFAGTGLTTLPPEIGQLTALTTLTSTQPLTTLPPEIGQLTALTDALPRRQPAHDAAAGDRPTHGLDDA